MDRENPQEHRALHDRDSASIDSAQRRGRTDTKSFWIRLTGDGMGSTPIIAAFSAQRA